MRKPRILVAFGTRPEAIKMFPVVEALRRCGSFDVRIVVTAQHRELLDQVMALTGMVADVDLDLMQANQGLDELAARVLVRFGAALDRLRPDRVLVHGDTLTTAMATLACYYRKIPVGHVEAGLRSGDIYSPWPEEANRRITAVIADLHFAPTPRAGDALWREGIKPASIFVTGNTAIDALARCREIIASRSEGDDALAPLRERFAGKRILAVTAHRRENFGHGMQQIALALQTLAQRPDIAIIFPLHPNPNVEGVMREALVGKASIALLAPLDYPGFVRMMEMSELILTDSGGVQEEAPSLGKPVLVMRRETERPEAIEAGTARLVGADCATIVQETNRLLDQADAYAQMASATNPFGDGQAASRIAAILQQHHGLAGSPATY